MQKCVCMAQPGPSGISESKYNCGLCQKTVNQKRERKVFTEDGAGKVHIDQLLRLCRSRADLSSEQMLTVVRNLQTSYKYICKTCQDELNTWERLKAAAMTKEEQIIGKMNALQTSHLVNTTGICRPPAALPRNLIPKRLKLPPNTSPEVMVRRLDNNIC